MEIKINKPIYDYILHHLVSDSKIIYKHSTTATTDILDLDEPSRNALLGRISSTIHYLTEAKEAINDQLK